LNQTQFSTASNGITPTTYRERERLSPPRSASAGVAAAPRRDIFKPGFTVISNTALDKVGGRLNGSEKRVLEWVQRLTTGFCREWVKQKVDEALQWCDLPRASFFRARKKLIELDLIELRQDLFRVVYVRLSAALQPLKAEHIVSLPNPFAYSEAPVKGESHSRDSQSQEWDCESQFWDSQEGQESTANVDEIRVCDELPEAPKEQHNKENSMKRQQQSSEADLLAVLPPTEDIVVEELVAIAEEPAPAAPLATDEPGQAQSHAGKGSGTLVAGVLSVEQAEFAAILLSAGVATPKNERLAKTRSAAAIGRALADLELRSNVKNPGGWLFEGLNSGRYDVEPVPVVVEPSEASLVREQERRPRASTPVTQSPAEREAMLTQVRQREAEQELADRGRQNQQTSDEVTHMLGSLTPDAYASLESQAMKSLGTTASRLPRAVILGQMMSLLDKSCRP
jgi:hypothetical protein